MTDIVFDAAALAGYGFRTRDFLAGPAPQPPVCGEALQVYGYSEVPRGVANDNTPRLNDRA